MTPLPEARELAHRLRLQTLDVDSATPDAAFERQQAAFRLDGKLLMVDEFQQLMNEDWEPMTPDLLDWGVHPYRLAVLRDGRAFSWHALMQMLSSLPADYTQDLEQEAAYQQSPSKEAIMQKFVTNELLPQAFTSVATSIKRDKCLPEGFQIRWIFNEERRCMGRVLLNVALGGIVPVVFDGQSDAVFHAMAEIMTGGTITVPRVPNDAIRFAIYEAPQSYGGFDLSADMSRYPFSSEGQELDFQLKPLGSHLCIWDGNTMLDVNQAGSFTERGQTYIRHQSLMFMARTDIPQWMRASEPFNTGDLHSQVLQPRGDDAIPNPLAILHDAAKTTFGTSLGEARTRAAGRSSGEFVAAACAFASPEAIEGYLYDVDDVYEGHDRVDLRRRGLDIRDHIAELRSYSDMTLGLLWARFEDIDTPWSEQALQGLLSALVLYSAFCAAGSDIEELSASGDAGILIADMLMSRSIEPNMARGCARETTILRDAFARHEHSLRKIQSWREEDDQQRRLRKEGVYLYAVGPVSRTKPKSMGELMNMARGRGLKLTLASQSFTDLKISAAGASTA